MTDSKSGKEVGNTVLTGMQPEAGHMPGHIYTYETGGISERKGNVPLWLWAVVLSLLIWGVYYLVTYWNAPAGPT